ncbi:UDP-N-acetylmuramate dehydrogenase [Candidimonas nitroreducens]|uniref:UDP-N-acetylmuramate dehydrogenase n=1 Tax=Candidimonas nitroreducens TaxID=683354 RepID=UPI0026D9B48C
MLHTATQDLSVFNTLGLRSQARVFVRLDDDGPRRLQALSALADEYGRKVFILGGGSNVVLAPQLDSLVVKVETRGWRVWAQSDTELVIEAKAGEVWHDFVALCVRNGWNGLENLALIPGTVGAAPVQNIGAYGVELEQRFHSLVAWDLHERRLVEMDKAACRFSYRDSFFKHEVPGRWLILAVRLRLPQPWEPVLRYPDLLAHPALGYGEEPCRGQESAAGRERGWEQGQDQHRRRGPQPGRWQEQGLELQLGPVDASPSTGVTARQVFDAVCEIRRRKLPDPALLPNAGSFFKNPVVGAPQYQALCAQFPGLVAYAQQDGRYKLAAGWLIDRAGWKGRRVGPVGVHERQALVLVNHGGASAADIEALAGAIRADVADRYGVELEQEPVRVV